MRLRKDVEERLNADYDSDSKTWRDIYKFIEETD